MTITEAQDAIAVAHARYPQLDWDGFHTHDLECCQADPQRVATAIAFLRQCAPVKRPNRSSYELKHCAESWGREHGMSPYVANGELLIAAAYLGFPIHRERWTSLNAAVGVARKGGVRK